MTLILPAHVVKAKAHAAARTAVAEAIKAKTQEKQEPFAELAKALEDNHGKDVVQAIDMPIPEGLPEPQQWRVTLMPVRQVAQSKGGLYLAPETLDIQNWTHMLWKVCAVGPFVYRGPAWHGFSEEELEAARPRIGDLYLVDPKMPRRYRYKGILFIVVNDDQLWSRVKPEHIDGLKFMGLEL